MFLALGLVLSTIGADDKAPPETPSPLVTPTAPMVSYDSRVVWAPRLDWRTAFSDRLRLVDRHEGTSVWAVKDRRTVTEIMKYLAENPRTNIVQLPHATVELGEPADQSALHRREYVAELTPRTETAKDAHSEVVLASYEPETATLDLGTTVRVTSSRMLGVGVQAHVKIQDRHLVAMHPLRRQVHERVEHRAPILGQVPLVNRLFRNVGIAEHEAEVEVPEVSTARIEGEWLYPTDGALIVSLGPVSNHADKTVGERLVVLTAQLVPLDPVPAP